jgi:hypothetical protein
VLDRFDILDIGNKNIASYRIEFMPAIHSPISYHGRHWYTKEAALPKAISAKHSYVF